ncbi:uncharacterized protein LOC132714377 [Ruditapes philippinarum]|uniref:uncharacterized protein LOC132714377 n=1 Tax=Ruditapes philippinarum TaxID=129788 RepID=UPI00295ACABE|nr:uncharacterized protein LOC132714377 [Ruditapes philippinarum]
MTLLRFKMSNNIFIIATMLLLFRGFQRTQADVEYYISRNTSTWEAASKECNLATPPIDFINLSLNISNIEITEDLWVGYYVASLDIEFVGCVHEAASHKISPYSGNSVVRCFSSCDSAPYFGLSSTRCFCFNTRPKNNSRDLVCEIDCKGHRCSPCERNGYMTLYKIYNGDANIQFIKRKETFYEVLRRMCPSGFEKGETSSIKQVVQRTFAIFKYNGTTAGINPIKIPTFGYVNVSKDQKLLNFRSSSQILRALCVKGSEAKTTEGDHSSIYIGVSIAVAVGVTSLAVSFVVILKRRNRIPKFCMNDESIKPIKELESTQKEGTSHRGIDSIGHMNPAFNKSEYMNTWNVDTADDNYDSSHYSSIVEEPRGKVNQPIESQSVKIPDVQQLHAKMESNITDQNAKGSDKDGSPSPHYFILEKIEKEADDPVSTKDLTRIEQQSMEKDNERNVYNTLNEAKIEMSDNVYDITERTANKSDTTYDTTGTASSQRREPEANYNSVVIGDDEYSHTGRDQIKYSKTDNVYGMQDQQGIHVQQFDKEDLENSETYNHLNMTKFNKNKTDNLYGFSKD